MNKPPVLSLLLAFIFTPALAQPNASPDAGTPLTFMDSKLFDGRLAKELAAGKDIVEVEISGKISLNSGWARPYRAHAEMPHNPTAWAPKTVPTLLRKWIVPTLQHGNDQKLRKSA